MKQNKRNTVSETTRPEGSYSPTYLKYKDSARAWAKTHKEYLRTYQREYQRKLRQDPSQYAITKARVVLRKYLSGEIVTSHKAINALGTTRADFATRLNISEKQLTSQVKRKELDHIVPTSYFLRAENAHLRPFMHRFYNINIVAKGQNRSKHRWFDPSDVKIELVLALLERDHFQSLGKYDTQSLAELEKLNDRVALLTELVKQKHGNN